MGCCFEIIKAQEIDVVNLSKDILYNVKISQPVDSELLVLKNLNLEELRSQLSTDKKKKAFYINIYNAMVQYELRNKPQHFEDRSQLFKMQFISIANHRFSLDDIEHGLLRNSQVKWGLGYIKRWFPGKIEKQLRVNELDYRVHFALNCGAGSCPSIAFYEAEWIEDDLKAAEVNFVESQCRYDKISNSVHVSKIFNWFKGDFNGKKGIYQLLETYKIILKGTRPKIVYDPYNWELLLEQYRY